MRISELSKQSDVRLPTIKYYIREGMLPAGMPLGPRDAEYDAGHLERLEIIRNLREIAQLSIETIKRLLIAADDPSIPLHLLAGIAHAAILPSASTSTAEPNTNATILASQFYTQLGWAIPEQHPVFAQTGRLLGLLKVNNAPHTAADLQLYAQAAAILTQTELGVTRTEGSRLLLVHDVVIGTYLSNELLLTLHMAAQVDQAQRQF